MSIPEAAFCLCAVILLMSRIYSGNKTFYIGSFIQFLSWKRFNVSRNIGNGLDLSSTSDIYCARYSSPENYDFTAGLECKKKLKNKKEKEKPN